MTDVATAYVLPAESEQLNSVLDACVHETETAIKFPAVLFDENACVIVVAVASLPVLAPCTNASAGAASASGTFVG